MKAQQTNIAALLEVEWNLNTGSIKRERTGCVCLLQGGVVNGQGRAITLFLDQLLLLLLHTWIKFILNLAANRASKNK